MREPAFVDLGVQAAFDRLGQIEHGLVGDARFHVEEQNVVFGQVDALRRDDALDKTFLQAPLDG